MKQGWSICKSKVGVPPFSPHTYHADVNNQNIQGCAILKNKILIELPHFLCHCSVIYVKTRYLPSWKYSYFPVFKVGEKVSWSKQGLRGWSEFSYSIYKPDYDLQLVRTWQFVIFLLFLVSWFFCLYWPINIVSFRSLLFSVFPFGVGLTVSGCGRAGRNREGTRFFYKVYLINIII